MCDCKQRIFRISLNLSNFFHDHRAMCKIFINKEMKYVSDLENHISKIFHIENFYLKSQNYFIPSTEDIRILQQEDNLFAVPKQSYDLSNAAVDSNTVSKRINNIEIPKGVTEQVENNSEQVESNSDNTNIPKKRKKKIHLHEEPETKYAKGDKKDEACESTSANVQFEHAGNIKNDTVPKSRKKKKPEESNVDKTSDSYVKDKVLCFEKISNLDELNVDHAKKKKFAKSICDQHLNNEQEDNKHIQENMPVNFAVQNEKKIQDNLFRKQQLFVQKRNTNIIAFKLPKTSNVVKSILVCNTSLKSTEGPSEIDVVLEKPATNVIENTTNTVKSTEQNPEFCYKETKTKLEPKIPDFFLNSHMEHSTPIVHLLKNNTPNDNSMDNTYTPKIKSAQDVRNTEQISENIEHADYKEISMDYLSEKNNNHPTVQNEKSINSNEKQISINNRSRKNSEESVHIISLEKSTEYLNNDGNCSYNSQIKTDLNDLNVSVGSEPSLLELKSCSSTFSEGVSNNCIENEGFITKRKRKRSHKKSKSKRSGINNTPVDTVMHIQTFEKISHSSVSPAIHIKYDENGEPLTVNNEMNQKESNKQSIGSSKETISFRQSIHKTSPDNDTLSTSLYEEAKQENDDNLVTTSDTVEVGSSIGRALISEDTILRSPLMTSTKPKIGDFIAFQTLRLTDNYTPEMSKHILGEIVYVTENGVDVDIRIIDGIEECKEPGGKFSIEDKDNSNKEVLDSIRSYSWNSLIWPRLIFP